jgi:flagellar hook assembly protein FlgD
MNPLYPNPFNRSVSIRYDIPLDSKIKLNVFNINGKHINTLFNGRTHAGTHSMSWNGLDKNGNIVSSGTYIVLLQANNFIYNHQENVNYIWDDYKETKKVILVK